MRSIFTFLWISLITVSGMAQQSKDAVIKEFAAGVVSFEEGELNEHSPIASFNKVAYSQAEKSIVITKENMAQSITEAAGYKTCIITVGTHTIAKVTNFGKSVMSGSWGCKMPYGQGYIQKGTLSFKEDFLNNIIGIPDTQRRMMYLFK